MEINKCILQSVINENITLPKKITSVRKLKKFIKKENKRLFKDSPILKDYSFLSYIWAYFYRKFTV